MTAPPFSCQTELIHAQVLATEVEQEEEYLVNNLQRRMGKLNLDKAELEKELEKLNRKVLI